MSGSDNCVVVFINALPMPGYIRGSARQRGRDALASAPIFSARNTAPPKLDMDYRGERMSQNFGGGSSGVSAASIDPFIDGEKSGSVAPVLPERGFMEASRDDQPTTFAEKSANNYAQPFTEDRPVPCPAPFQRDRYGSSLVIPRSYAIVFLLLVGFIICLVYYASRGNYYYFKLEIGGYDLN